MNIKTVDSDTTLTGSEYTVVVKANTTDTNIYLPYADEIVGKIYIIVAHKDNNSDVVVHPQNTNDEINGNSTIKLTAQEIVQIQCDGTEWVVIGG